MDKIVVTGSLIPTTAAEVGSAPVAIMSAEALDRQAVKTPEQLAKVLPAAIGSGNFGSSRGNGGDGSANISLRGIPGGTLVLMNGRRLAPVSTGGGSRVDINTIPLAMVERVEVLLDGGSAIYGADAVAGVVNFITKKNFNGTEFGAYYGNTTSTDVGRQDYYFVTGLSDEKNSFVFGGEYYKQNSLYSRDRDRSRPDPTDPGQTSPTSNPGRIQTTTVPAGNPLRDVGLVYRGDPGTTGTNPSQYTPFSNSTDRFNFGLYTPAVRDEERYSFFGSGEREIFGENLKFVAEANYTHIYSYNQLAPTPAVFANLTLNDDGIGIIVPANNPYNPFGIALDRVRYRPDELGPRIDQVTGDNFRIYTGLKGQIGDTTMFWEAGFQYGRDSRVEMSGNDINANALEAAVNQTDPLLAFNPFGNRANLPGVLDAMRQNLWTINDLDVMNVGAKVYGDAVELPAGMLGIAAGIEHGELHLSQEPDKIQQLGDVVGFNASQPLEGKRHVDSAFAEFKIPLASPDQDIPVLYKVDVTAALRFDNYSDFGNTWNPKVLVRWQPIDDTLTIRGSYSTSFIPPSMGDLYTLDQESYPELRNPVKVAMGDATYFDQIRTFYSGNPQLEPEEAENYTAGIVWSPKFIKNFTISIDWFKINEDSIPGSVDQFILDQNYQGANPALPPELRPTDPNAPFANLITYDPTTREYIRLNAPTLNLSQRVVEGLDFGIRYEIPTDKTGTFGLLLNVTHYYKFLQENIPGDGLGDRLGDFVDPSQSFGLGSIMRWKGNIGAYWQMNGWELSATGYYIGSYLDDKAAGFDRQIDSMWTLDMQAGYSFQNESGAFSGVRVAVGVQNLLDQEPPLVQGAFADNYDRDTHSLLGRFVYGQISKKF